MCKPHGTCLQIERLLDLTHKNEILIELPVRRSVFAASCGLQVQWTQFRIIGVTLHLESLPKFDTTKVTCSRVVMFRWATMIACYGRVGYTKSRNKIATCFGWRRRSTLVNFGEGHSSTLVPPMNGQGCLHPLSINPERLVRGSRTREASTQ